MRLTAFTSSLKNFCVGVYNAVTSPVGGYRDQSALLFQTTPSAKLASRLPIGNPSAAWDLDFEKWGPTFDLVDKHTEWRWTTPGGDWLDAAHTVNGVTAWASTPVPYNGTANAISDHSFDVTLALQFIQENNRWAAFNLLQSNAPRKLLTNLWPDPQLRPRIEVIYQDASTATLVNTICAGVSSSSTIPATTLQSVSFGSGTGNLLIEFQRPTKPVQSAIMYFSCTDLQWSGNPTDVKLAGVLNPPTRGSVVPGGLAQGVGITAFDGNLISDPNAIFVQRYLDGSVQEDFIANSFTNLYDNEYSPEIFGGAVDMSKLPYLHAGKWLNGNSVDRNLTLVNSAYTGEGFIPLAPGLGALRTHISAHSPAPVDGTVVGTSGALGSHASIPLPIDRIGYQQHIRVRYYQRVHIDRPLGPLTPENRRHYWQTPDSVARWNDRSGKGGIFVSHDTVFGGFSGSSGGNKGWQMRGGWAICDAGTGGPDEGAINYGFHLYDFLANNPAGHRYGSGDGGMGERFGQLGGFGGTFEFDRWYCIEKEMRLNTVNPETPYPAYVADGLLRSWVDGVLVYEQTGMVFRQTPVYTDVSKPAGTTFVTPMRDLGIRNIICNFFYGGQTWPTESLTQFFSGLVVTDGASGYIGPMKLS